MMNNEIPKSAQRVFRGKVFEVWQWEQTMYDGSTAIFERLRRADSASVIAVVGDKILIQDERQPDRDAAFVSLPGGVVDEGEQPQQAAERELLEETGYVSDDWELFSEENPTAKIIWTSYTFIARNCIFKQSPHLDAGEKIQTRLVTFDQFLDLADDSTFRIKGLITTLVRAKFDPVYRAAFHARLFGTS